MTWVIHHAPNDLTASEMLVLLMLAEHADAEGGHAFPSIETLARETRCSKSAVQRSLKRLVERSVIAIEEPATRRLPNMYCFPFFRGGKMTPHNDSGVSFEQFRGSKMTPKPSDITVNGISTPNVVDIPTARASKKCSLPDQWEPTPETIATLAAKGWLPEQIERQREAFVSSAQAKGYQYVDWQAAFRNWFTSQYQKEQPGVRSNGQSNGHATGKLGETEHIAGTMRYLREQIAAGSGLPPVPSPPSVTERDTIEVAFQEGHHR